MARDADFITLMQIYMLSRCHFDVSFTPSKIIGLLSLSGSRATLPRLTGSPAGDAAGRRQSRGLFASSPIAEAASLAPPIFIARCRFFDAIDLYRLRDTPPPDDDVDGFPTIRGYRRR